MSSRPTSAERLVVARVRQRAPELVDRVVARARAEMAAYASLPAATIAASTSSVVVRLLDALHDGHPLTSGDLAAVREFGETRARQGISLADIQNGWRIAVREIFAELTDAAAVTGVADRTLLRLTPALLDLVDAAVVPYSGGHRDVEIAAARHDEQFRAEFTRAALLGTLGPGDLRIRAQQLGVDPEAEYRAYRARAETPLDSAPSLPTRGFVTTVDGDIAGFVEKSRSPVVGGVVGLGPPTRLEDLARSFRLAGRVLTTAQMFGRTGTVDLDSVGVLPAIAADTDLGAELVRRYLASLGGGESARTIIDTVESYLDTGLRVEATAERLVVHPNTVRYRLSRFEELTGADLRAAHTALEVWWAVQFRKTQHPG
ncbi:PucR C-terminal helix-turn-helix domain-containing protein [Nocardia amikacinitolerans]|uniref:PucR family transcriptional regulator n=1 Tax=Nocardia amikacinitolerans TaxID=756689 RepID=UPI00082B4B90|nr:PucR family transcriptional regulator [Nocardia amikacinitolerans]MCP2315488.1 PucR C-terminal helix-turn-helix domain-containing protein [Nocardia amikacinitolerans]